MDQLLPWQWEWLVLQLQLRLQLKPRKSIDLENEKRKAAQRRKSRSPRRSTTGPPEGEGEKAGKIEKKKRSPVEPGPGERKKNPLQNHLQKRPR